MITPLDILSIETWVLLLTALVIFRWYVHKKWQVLAKLNIPHKPPSLLGFGNLREFAKDPDSLFNKDLIKKKEFGYIYGSYVGLQPRISISDPNILKQIFIKEFSTFTDRQNTFRKVNGKEMNTALTAVQGTQWRRIRNTMSPNFSTSKLKEMFDILESCTDKMVLGLHHCVEEKDGRFSVKEVFSKLSMDFICSATFSADLHTQVDEGEPKIIQMGKKLFDIDFSANVFFFLFFLFPWLENIGEFFDYSLMSKDAIKYFSSLTDHMIKTKKDMKTRVDFLRLMLNQQISDDEAHKKIAKGITRNEIVGNSILMILAGYETTANAMLFVAYNLAAFQDAQERARQEVEQVVEKHGGLTYAALNDTKYLMQCINESLRIYPAIPRNSRFSNKEVTIDGMTIPAGIHVDIPSYGMSHDEEYWDDPWTFNPDRMEDMSKIDPMVFQPFGAGPRNCIGQRLALMEMKMAIGKVLMNFDLELCEDTPKPPVAMTFKASM